MRDRSHMILQGTSYVYLEREVITDKRWRPEVGASARWAVAPRPGELGGEAVATREQRNVDQLKTGEI